MSVDEILDMVKNLLKERREAPCGDWAQMTEEDLKGFRETFQAIIDAKLEPDVDGDVPLEVFMIDRRKFKRMHYVPVPYGHKAETSKDMEEIERAVSNNISTATRELDDWFRMRLFEKQTTKSDCQAMASMMKKLLGDLPSNKDWLDPELEKWMKSAVKQMS